MTKVLIVKSLKEGYRRCGRAFSSSNPTVLDVGDLSKEEITRLKEDTGLIVVEADKGANAAAAHAVGQVNAELEAALKKAETVAAQAQDRVKELEESLAKVKAEAGKAVAEGNAQIEDLKANLAKAEKAAAEAVKAAKK